MKSKPPAASDQADGRKRVEDALRASEARYRTLFDAMDEGFCILQMIFDGAEQPIDYRFLEINPAFERQTGLRDAVGRRALELVPDLEPRWFTMYGEVACTGQSKRFEDHSEPMGRWFDVFAFRIGAPEERKVALLFSDITQRKEAEQRAQYERQKLHDTFQQAPVAIAIVEGPDFTFTLANPRYLQLVGRDESIVGKPLDVALPGIDPQFHALLAQVVATGEAFFGTEVPVQLPGRPHDDPVYMNFAYQPLRHPDGSVRGVLACGVDVTAQVVARRGVEAERDLRERFVALLSHDLRTPLSSAKMGAELIMRREPSPEIVQKAAQISRNVDRADQMIQDMLDASRLRAGEKLGIELEPCDLSKLASETLAELAAMHGDRFVLRASPQLDGTWSASGLRRIIENLCTNAVKYGAQDTPITLAIAEDGDRVQLAVHNAGNPLPPDQLENLFEPFHRMPSAQSGGQKGWGLGLSLVRGVAEAHGGSVAASSSEAAGTTFTVTLPRHARTS
jgi:PAS domain S-box-containing protein